MNTDDTTIIISEEDRNRILDTDDEITETEIEVKEESDED